MKKEYLYALIGLLAGALIMVTVSSYAVNNEMTGMMNMMGIKEHSHAEENDSQMVDTMNRMTHGLENSVDFDKAFLTEMITHHQGAILMAQQAKTEAKHQEIKTMADDIITAQTREIEMMRQWQKDWGY